MKYLCYYFAQHREFGKAVYFLGSNSDFSELASLLDTAVFEDLRLVFEDEGKREALLRYLSQEQLSRFAFLDKQEFRTRLSEYGKYCFIADNYADQGELILFAEANPMGLVGYFQAGFDSFGLWEGYRDHCDTMAIARFVNPLRNEVLDWRKEYEKELSIVFPVYNVGAYIRQCVESVTAWKAPYVEFLFVSDGSKDDSVAILKEYAAKDSRLRILEKENGGCASARQYGLDRAAGRYIGFVDPDDYVDETMFRKLLSRAFTGTYEIAYSGYNEYYEDSGECEPIEDMIGMPYEAGTTDEGLIDDLIAYRRIAIWRGIYSASLLRHNGIVFHQDLPRFDDLPFKVETLALAKSVVSVPEYLYYYRLGRRGQDVSVDDERLYVHFDIFKHLDAFFASPRSSRQKDLYRIVKVQTHAWALSRLKPSYREEYRRKAAGDIGIENTKKAWIKAVGECGGKAAVEAYKKTLRDSPSPLSRHTISLVVPCYDRLGTLEETLQTLESAPSLRYEVILVDDGSGEEAGEKIRALAQAHRHCRYIRLPHGGVSKARNAGLKAATGDYVWFVDSDDDIPDEAVASIAEGLAVEGCDFYCFDAQARRGEESKRIQCGNYDKGDPLLTYLNECADIPFVWNRLYRKSFLRRNRIHFDTSIALGEDALFNFLCCQKAKKARTVHRLLYVYRQWEDGSSMDSYYRDESFVLREHNKVAASILAHMDPNATDEKTKSALMKYLECLVVRGDKEIELAQMRDKLLRQIKDLGWR